MRKNSFGAQVRNKVVAAVCSVTLAFGLCPAIALADEVAEAPVTEQPIVEVVEADADADEAVEAVEVVEVEAEDGDLEEQAYDANSKYTATLSLATTTPIVKKTFQVKLNVKTSDSSSSPLSCMQVTVQYDPAKVSLGENNISIASSLTQGDCTDNGNGTAIITFYGNTASDITAATLTFTGVAVGDPGIKITDAIAGASGQLDDKGVKYSTTNLPARVHFPDVADSSKFYYGNVYAAVDAGLLSGYKDGTFGPNDTLTRAQAAVILWGAYGKPAYPSTNQTGMPDVADNAYYTNAANWAVANGVINGSKTASGTLFNPNGKITRQDLCVMISNTAYKLNGVSIGGADRTKLNSMSDSSTVSGYAVNAVAWSLNNGVINGKGTAVAPLDNVTRGEMATIAMNALRKGFIG